MVTSKPHDVFAWERFRTLLFRLGETMAHELCHVFTLYLLFSRSRHTPPRITYGPWGNKDAGESGRWWESRMFGGYIDMRMGTSMERVAIRHGSGTKTAIIGPRAITAMMYKGMYSSSFSLTWHMYVSLHSMSLANREASSRLQNSSYPRRRGMGRLGIDQSARNDRLDEQVPRYLPGIRRGRCSPSH